MKISECFSPSCSDLYAEGKLKPTNPGKREREIERIHAVCEFLFISKESSQAHGGIIDDHVRGNVHRACSAFTYVHIGAWIVLVHMVKSS